MGLPTRRLPGGAVAKMKMSHYPPTALRCRRWISTSARIWRRSRSRRTTRTSRHLIENGSLTVGRVRQRTRLPRLSRLWRTPARPRRLLGDGFTLGGGELPCPGFPALKPAPAPQLGRDAGDGLLGHLSRPRDRLDDPGSDLIGVLGMGLLA